MLSDDELFDSLRHVFGLQIAVNTMREYYRMSSNDSNNAFAQLSNGQESVSKTWLIDNWMHTFTMNPPYQITPLPSVTATPTVLSIPKAIPDETNTTIHHLFEVPPERKRFECKYCGKTFASTDGVRKHWKRTHGFDLPKGDTSAFATAVTEQTRFCRASSAVPSL